MEIFECLHQPYPHLAFLAVFVALFSEFVLSLWLFLALNSFMCSAHNIYWFRVHTFSMCDCFILFGLHLSFSFTVCLSHLVFICNLCTHHFDYVRLVVFYYLQGVW